MHCIVSGGGLTKEHRLRKSGKNFFIPVFVLRNKFQRKFLALLDSLYHNKQLVFSSSFSFLQDPSAWNTFKNSLYEKEWCPYIKKTFNGFGNAIEYLGKSTHKIVISNAGILSVNETESTFSAGGRKPGDSVRNITLSNEEFIRRYLMHVVVNICGLMGEPTGNDINVLYLNNY